MTGRRALALMICLSGGCASHQPPDLSSHFIRKATNPDSQVATFDAPRDPAASSKPAAALDPALADGMAVGPVPKSSDLPTVEQKDEALSAALTALKTHPSAEAHRRVAEEYGRLRIFDAAYDQLMAAVQIAPRDAATFDALARMWRDSGFPGLGLTPAYRAVNFAPKWAQAENTLGTVLYALGEVAGAQQHFEQALSLDPGAGYVLNNLCYVAFVRGELPRALALCGQAVQLAPELPAARANLAAVEAAARK